MEHPQQSTFIHARSFIHFIQWEAFLFFVLCITSLSTNEIGRYLTYLEYLPEWKSATWGMIVGRWQLSGSVYVFLIVTLYTLTLNWLTARLCERPAAFPSFARYKSLLSAVFPVQDHSAMGLPLQCFKDFKTWQYCPDTRSCGCEISPLRTTALHLSIY